MLDFASPLEWAVAIFTVFAGAAVQGTLGLGLAIISVPILATLDSAFVPVPVQLIAVVVAIAALVRERSDLDVRGAAWVLVGRVPGALIGLAALSLLSERVLDLVVGLVVLFGVVVIGRGWSVPVTPTTQVATGITSGAMGLSTGVGGPPLGMLYRSRSGPQLRSTLGAVFTLGLGINLTTLAIAGRIGPRELVTAGVLVVPLVAGFALSGTITRRVPPASLRAGVLAISALAAVVLLVTVALGG